MNDRTCYLYWREQLIGVITNAAYIDFPWLGGMIELAAISNDIKVAFTYFHAMVEEDTEQLPDLPIADEMWKDWFIVTPDGKKRNISPPIVDFENGDVTWR